MKATIQKQSREDGVTSVTVEHTEIGYQLQITQGPQGFMVHSSQGVKMEFYSENTYQLLPERGYDECTK
jgi:hypothetical protein